MDPIVSRRGLEGMRTKCVWSIFGWVWVHIWLGLYLGAPALQVGWVPPPSRGRSSILISALEITNPTTTTMVRKKMFYDKVTVVGKEAGPIPGGAKKATAKGAKKKTGNLLLDLDTTTGLLLSLGVFATHC